MKATGARLGKVSCVSLLSGSKRIAIRFTAFSFSAESSSDLRFV